jgi:hypothetical protein
MGFFTKNTTELTAKDIETIEIRKAEHEEKMLGKYKAFMADLQQLPQFINLHDGLLHGLSGCMVSSYKVGLRLTWVSSSSSVYSYSSGGQEVYLRTEEQLERFMALMQLEAKKLQS